jgi:ADP-heptose:LPS heptosyltransferase
VFREIKKHDPSVEIGVVYTPKNQLLIQDNPYIDYFHLLPSRSLKNHFKLGQHLAKCGYDTVIDPTVFLRNRDLLLLSMINAVNYIGYKKSDYQLFNHSIEGEWHFSEIYSKALALCGVQNVDSTYDVPSCAQSEQAVQAVQAFLQENHLHDYIALNFFGAASKRTFSAENMQRFLAYFRAHLPQKQIVLLTYPAVTPLLKPLLSDNKGIFIYEDTLTILDTIALMRQADWVISPDTAIIHIATGLNKKLVGFYQQNDENWQNWHPNSKAECHIVHFAQNINEIQPEMLNLAWFN